MRDQAISSRRKVRRRTIRSASSVRIRQGGAELAKLFLRTIPVLAYLVVLILAAWLLYYSIVSPHFAVRDIVVSGNRLLDADQAREASEALGQNALLLRADVIENSLRKTAVVRESQALLTLPGRLELDVIERTPLVQWQFGDTTFLVDREGVAFSREAPPSPVAMVKQVDGSPVEVGSRVDPDILAAIVTLDGALRERAALQPLWFEYSRTGIAVPMQGGTRVVFGDASDLDSKLTMLSAIRGRLEATKSRADLIDLRFKGRPIYTLVAPTPAKSGQAR